MFKKKKKPEFVQSINLEINGKLMPQDRGYFYADPLIDALEKAGIGEVDGEGTLLEEDGSIKLCDIHMMLEEGQEALDKLLLILEALHLPKGSRLIDADGNEIAEIGVLEGLALWMNGTELPEEVYKECDINHVVKEINKLLDGCGELYSHWAGPSDTALYFYGTSFEEMKAKILPFVNEYPLCQKHRIEQVA
ncbi:MAG: hypothetical protein FWB98_02970 [Defluviitaleaceae bacterium]|nr:hypothetical protein [Defluviitaleaceae bacterium]